MGFLAISDSDDVDLCVLTWKGVPDVLVGTKLKEIGYNVTLFFCKVKKSIHVYR